MKRRRRWIIPLAILAAVVIILSVASVYIVLLLFTPAQPTGEYEEIEFEIEQGELLDSIARRLASAGLLRDPSALKLAAFFGGGSEMIKAGVHPLRGDWSAWKIYRQIQLSPHAKHRRLVIPEGFDIFEIARRVEKAGISSAEDFYRLARDPGPIADLAPGAPSLEGYLFPDTYHVPVDFGPEEVVGMMLRRFREAALEKLRGEFAARGLSLSEGVILASMIAREAGNREEMPLVSSVFHNRLKDGMKLDCDPTFIYARKLMGTWDGVVRGEDRALDSDYNTYRRGGLPPGPIGNPGADALLAAARPADTKYLYFVAKGTNIRDGHFFSATPAEHNRARARYEKNRRAALDTPSR